MARPLEENPLSGFVFDDELPSPLSAWQRAVPPSDGVGGVYFARRKNKMNWAPLLVIGGAILSLLLILVIWLATTH